MNNCANCGNAEYTNEGHLTYFYRCKITRVKYLQNQAESFCCEKHKIKNEVENGQQQTVK